MKEIRVTANDAGQRLDRFLGKAFPSMGQGFICGMVRKKRIKVGGRRCETNYRLCEGDIISLYINDEMLEEKKQAKTFLDVPADINVVYEDENVLLIDKPVGLVVHEDDENTADTLINRVLHYLYDKGEYIPENEQSFVPSLCNRIDRNTGGIVMAAKTAAALRILNQKIHDRELTKKYLCLTVGCPQPESALLTAYLEKKSDENRVVVSDRKTPSNLTIKTKYTVLDSCGEMSLLEVELLTGRTHQIRAHMAHMGHPLIGDGKYGSNKVNRQLGYKHQALYSYYLRFDFTTDSGELSYLNHRAFRVKDVWFVDKFNEYKENKRK